MSLNGINGSNFLKLKGTDQKLNLDKLQGMGLTKNNQSIFTRYDKNKDDGSFTRTYIGKDGQPTGEIQNFDSNGTETGGKLTNGNTYTTTYNEDGSYVDHFTQTQENGGGTYEYHYDKDKKINKYVGLNGTTIERNENGDITGLSPKNGESFQQTMERLGITNPEDQEAFRQANPVAARKGYFIVGAKDIVIPASITLINDWGVMITDDAAEIRAYQNSIRHRRR